MQKKFKKTAIAAATLITAGAVLTLLAGCSTAAVERADSAAVPTGMPWSIATKTRTIIFVWDGMRPDSISAADTPHLLALKQKGSYFSNNHSTYPTFTMMNAASFATGSFPGTTGFFGNTLWQTGPSGKNSGNAAVDFQQPVFTEDYAVIDDLDAYYSNQLFLVGSLFSAAQHAGLVTAAVGKSGPAYLQDRKRGGYILDENTVLPLSLAKELAANGYALPANTRYSYNNGEFTLGSGGKIAARPARVSAKSADGSLSGDPTDHSGGAGTDYNKSMMDAYLNYILPQKHPDLSVVWLRDPDATEHSYGPGSANYHLALQAQDARLGDLMAKLKELGMDKTTNVIIVSDHGHSNVSGPVDLFPLRSVKGGLVGETDPTGFSASGDVRTAHLLTLAGFQHVYDGAPCASSGMGGQKADGSFVYPVMSDNRGLCGGTADKPVSYQTPSYKVPAIIPDDAVVIAANGGSDYLYVKNHDPARVARLVRFLQSREQYGAVFVAKRYEGIPGTLPLNNIKVENSAGRNPDIIVSFTWDAEQKIAGMPGIEFESFSQNRGMHGSFSPIDVHNTLLAYGPDFHTQFVDPLPSGNVDLAPTVAAILGVSLPEADGRPLLEAMTHATTALHDYSVQPHSLTSTTAQGLDFILPTSVDTRDVDTAMAQKTYQVHLQTQVLTFQNKTYTYFDYAKAIRN